MRVLLLEDDEVYGFMIEHHLREHYNAYVERYYSSREGKENTDQHFDLIIADYMLADDTARKLIMTTLKEFPNVPIVVLSGTTDEKLVKELIIAGVTCYINKREEVFSELEKVIGRIGFKSLRSAR